MSIEEALQRTVDMVRLGARVGQGSDHPAKFRTRYFYRKSAQKPDRSLPPGAPPLAIPSGSRPQFGELGPRTGIAWRKAHGGSLEGLE